jgi:FMN phosphatase YigB (HAD superfamily)
MRTVLIVEDDHLFRKALTTFLSSLGFETYGVATAEEAGYYKPQPPTYRMALERLGCAAENVLFVAGSASDVPGASNVGMPCETVDTLSPPRRYDSGLRGHVREGCDRRCGWLQDRVRQDVTDHGVRDLFPVDGVGAPFN